MVSFDHTMIPQYWCGCLIYLLSKRFLFTCYVTVHGFFGLGLAMAQSGVTQSCGCEQAELENAALGGHLNS